LGRIFVPISLPSRIHPPNCSLLLLTNSNCLRLSISLNEGKTAISEAILAVSSVLNS